ncbi:MAG TPA: hypothetical protein ENJ45_06160, partial [Phaeodactylibacter sp.]|nr:hypothetical protein [Phaeodactylibacter sp.]
MLTILLFLSMIANANLNPDSEDRIWDGGGGDQLWMNPLNWDNDQLPEADADVWIVTNETVIFDAPDYLVESITLLGGAHLIIEEGASLRTFKGGPFGSDAIHLEGVDSTMIESQLTIKGNLLIDMHGAVGDGLDLNKYTKATVTNTGYLEIKNTGDDGIELSDDLVVQGTLFIQDTDANGIRFHSVVPDGAMITNTGIIQIDTTGNYGIWLNSALLFDNQGTTSIANCTAQSIKASSYTFHNKGAMICQGSIDEDSFTGFPNASIEVGPYSPTLLTFSESFSLAQDTIKLELFALPAGMQPLAGIDYDQFTITSGTIDLSQAILELTGDYIPQEGDSLTLLQNLTGSNIIGHFDALPQGSSLFFNGVEMLVSYTGDSNHMNMTLTAISSNVVDADGDGFTNDVDCDDSNATVYPDAPELCDNLDNNCNGSIDEGLASFTYFLDADGDGFGNANAALDTCA